MTVRCSSLATVDGRLITAWPVSSLQGVDSDCGAATRAIHRLRVCPRSRFPGLRPSLYRDGLSGLRICGVRDYQGCALRFIGSAFQAYGFVGCVIDYQGFALCFIGSAFQACGFAGCAISRAATFAL